MTKWEQDAGSADEAVAAVSSRMRVFVHGAAATPTPLLEALARRGDLTDVLVMVTLLAGVPSRRPGNHRRSADLNGVVQPTALTARGVRPSSRTTRSPRKKMIV